MSLSTPFRNISPKKIIEENKKAGAGFFPLGQHGLWHTGIHVKINKPIVAMADGHIIAYRINDKYQEISSDLEKILELDKSNHDQTYGKEKKFSTGFVLMKHDYESILGLHITFYTLYMHLLSKDNYNEKLKPPPYLNKNRYFASKDTVIYTKSSHVKSYDMNPMAHKVKKDEEIFLKKEYALAMKCNGEPLDVYDIVGSRYRLAPNRHYFVDKNDVKKEKNAPEKYNEVVNLDTPMFIKAGQIIGYPGQDNLVHIELFTDNADFLNSAPTFNKRDFELLEKKKTVVRNPGDTEFNLYNWQRYFKLYEAQSGLQQDFAEFAKTIKHVSGKDVHTALHTPLPTRFLIIEARENKKNNKDDKQLITHIIKNKREVFPFLQHNCIKCPTNWSSETTTYDRAYKKWQELYQIPQEDIEGTLTNDYLSKFNFWEDVSGLGSLDKENLFFFHPITFIEHLRKLEEWYPAAILYPSLLCPAIADVNDPVMHVFILTNEDFKKRETRLKNDNKEITVKKILATLLRLEPWNDIAGRNGLKITNSWGGLLDSRWDTATLDEFITYQYVGRVNTDFKWQSETEDGESKSGVAEKLVEFNQVTNHPFYASVAQWGLEPYFKYNFDYTTPVRYSEIGENKRGLLYGYVISLNLKQLVPEEPNRSNRLMHISWKPYLDKEDNLWKDVQDELVYKYLTTNRSGKGEKHSPLYKVESINQTGIEALQECDDVVKPTAYHPVFFTAKDYLNFGQLSDVHLDVRQYILESSPAQLMPGVNPGSPKIGSIIANTVRVFSQALNILGESEDIDLLFLTGDLVNQTSNVDPVKYRTDTKNANKIFNIWEGVKVKGNFDDNPFHQWNIDSRVAMSLLLNYYRQYQKPVVSLIGNHEDFPIPYGISPRPGGVKRADEMMCADHNLTYSEAILMFGPTYGQVVYDEGKGSLNLNMNPQRRFFFHLFFNPLADFFVFTRNQTFLCLDWEEGQDIFDVLSKDFGGHLTRAKKAVSARQLALIDKCLNNPKRKKILLSHFTYLSANEHIPLNNLVSEVESESGTYGPSSDFAHGSFNSNRSDVYEKLFKTANTNKFDYIISGHTHRAGGYEVVQCSSGTSVQFKGKVLGSDFVKRTEKPFVLISGSAGPIAKQNINGEFKKWGHEMPNGNWVIYNKQTGNDEYKVFYIGHDSAPEPVSVKPRFAVAMDYFNIMEIPVFPKFDSMKDAPNIFNIRLNSTIFPKKPEIAPVISKLSLFYYNPAIYKFVEIQAQLSSNEPFAFNCVFSSEEFHKATTIIKKQNESQFTFLSLVFSKIDKPGFDQYNYESPWIFRVNFRDIGKTADIIKAYGRSLPTEMTQRAYDIITHLKAEVPDFELYKRVFKDDYRKIS